MVVAVVGGAVPGFVRVAQVVLAPVVVDGEGVLARGAELPDRLALPTERDERLTPYVR